MTELLERLLRWSSRMDGPAHVAFSGGMDSLLVALCVRKFAPARCVVAGTPACDDLWHARRLKARYDLPLEVVEMGPAAYEAHARAAAPLLDPANAMTLNLSVVMSVVAEKAGGGTVVTGLGADEMFLGYQKYRSGQGLAKRDADMRQLVERDIPRYSALASRFGVRMSHPFLEAGLGGAVPVDVGKREVVEALRAFGVSPSVIRPKRAMQFGSGVSRLLKGIARSKNMTENALVLHYMEDKGAPLNSSTPWPRP